VDGLDDEQSKKQQESAWGQHSFTHSAIQSLCEH
jgi:hypothetical protein